MFWFYLWVMIDVGQCFLRSFWFWVPQISGRLFMKPNTQVLGGSATLFIFHIDLWLIQSWLSYQLMPNFTIFSRSLDIQVIWRASDSEDVSCRFFPYLVHLMNDLFFCQAVCISHGPSSLTIFPFISSNSHVVLRVIRRDLERNWISDLKRV